MTWWQTALIVAGYVFVLAAGWVWGLCQGLNIGDETLKEQTERLIELEGENIRLRNDLTRQLNKQFEL